MHPLSRRTSVKSETIKLITVHLHRLLNYAKTFLATQVLGTSLDKSKLEKKLFRYQCISKQHSLYWVNNNPSTFRNHFHLDLSIPQ